MGKAEMLVAGRYNIAALVRRNIENMDRRVEMLYRLFLMVDMSQ